MFYLKKFNDHNEYEDYMNGVGGGVVYIPNTSLLINDNDIYYNKPRMIIKTRGNGSGDASLDITFEGITTNHHYRDLISKLYNNGIVTIDYNNVRSLYYTLTAIKTVKLNGITYQPGEMISQWYYVTRVEYTIYY